MASKIVELFGYAPTDQSAAARNSRANCLCPFAGDGNKACTKEIGDRSNRIKSGVCSISDSAGQPVVICPIRMYADNYQLLKDVASLAFKTDAIELVNGSHAASHQVKRGKSTVTVFGKGWGGELRLPGSGLSDENGRRLASVFVDWILARLDKDKIWLNSLRSKCRRWIPSAVIVKSATRTCKGIFLAEKVPTRTRLMSTNVSCRNSFTRGICWSGKRFADQGCSLPARNLFTGAFCPYWATTLRPTLFRTAHLPFAPTNWAHRRLE